MGKLYGHGFDPDACEDCPHHTFYSDSDDERSLVERIGGLITATEEGYWGCGLCGCPTAEGMPMDRFDAPPEDCPRLPSHRQP